MKFSRNLLRSIKKVAPNAQVKEMLAKFAAFLTEKLTNSVGI